MMNEWLYLKSLREQINLYPIRILLEEEDELSFFYKEGLHTSQVDYYRIDIKIEEYNEASA